MRIVMTALVVLFCANMVFAADLTATGHDWLKYSQDEKVALVKAVHEEIGVVDAEAFSPEDIAQNMDMMYKFKEGQGLDTPCIDLISVMAEKKEAY
ncbi:MAG: hypothetical protein ABH862_01375 [Candidatus Omnitrophota bacterium]